MNTSPSVNTVSSSPGTNLSSGTAVILLLFLVQRRLYASLETVLHCNFPGAPYMRRELLYCIDRGETREIVLGEDYQHPLCSNGKKQRKRW